MNCVFLSQNWVVDRQEIKAEATMPVLCKSDQSERRNQKKWVVGGEGGGWFGEGGGVLLLVIGGEGEGG